MESALGRFVDSLTTTLGVKKTVLGLVKDFASIKFIANKAAR